MPSPSSSEAGADDSDRGLAAHTTVSLGSVNPCGSRQRGRRSAVALTDRSVVVGTAGGDLRAFDRDPARAGDAESPGEPDAAADAPRAPERWRLAGEEPVVALAPFDGGVLAGTRGERGVVRLVDADGAERWRVEAADDVGTPTKQTRFRYPFVAALATHGDRAYAVARRYERRGAAGGADTDGDASGDDDAGSARRFESVVYALEADGTVAWRHAARASPIAAAADGDRVAVAYNRCPEPDAHDDGLVVLDPGSGDVRLRWDPRRAPDARSDADATRSVGDVALMPEGYAVASQADYRGYLLDRAGSVAGAVDLGTPVERETGDGSDRVYAYPNHVHAGADGVAYVVGNSFPTEGRETPARHPAEHTAVGVDLGGDERWRADVGGFAHHVAAAGDALAVPVAQHFRDRDPAVHGVRLFDVNAGRRASVDTDGVATAVAVDGTGAAAVEEPVAYHDDGAGERGAYRLHRWRR